MPAFFRNRLEVGLLFLPTVAFAGCIFLATVTNAALESQALMQPMMYSAADAFGGTISSGNISNPLEAHGGPKLLRLLDTFDQPTTGHAHLLIPLLREKPEFKPHWIIIIIDSCRTPPSTQPTIRSWRF